MTDDGLLLVAGWKEPITVSVQAISDWACCCCLMRDCRGIVGTYEYAGGACFILSRGEVDQHSCKQDEHVYTKCPHC